MMYEDVFWDELSGVLVRRPCVLEVEAKDEYEDAAPGEWGSNWHDFVPVDPADEFGCDSCQ